MVARTLLQYILEPMHLRYSITRWILCLKQELDLLSESKHLISMVNQSRVLNLLSMDVSLHIIYWLQLEFSLVALLILLKWRGKSLNRMEDVPLQAMLSSETTDQDLR
jgi:hypothetical protein